MHNDSLKKIVTLALKRVRTGLEDHVPRVSDHVLVWLRSLSKGRPIERYWTAPEAFPMLHLPWWLEETFCRSEIPPLQPDLIYSSINIYCFIRLIDNAMDQDVPTDLKLLPALGVFHTEFQSPYHRYFGCDHPFWEFFTRVWFRSAEVTMLDASIPRFRLSEFINVAGKKMCAAKIPIAAVAYKYQRADVIPIWSDFVDRFGCWSQMLNDTFDWYKDSFHGRQTYFLSEAARRKKPIESVTEWFVREGFEWSMDRLETWMCEMRPLAEETHSAALLTYLERRVDLLAKKRKEMCDGLQNLARFRAALTRQNGS